MINFVFDKERVRFEINHAALKAGGLMLNSHVLQLATHVYR
jgi:hypothetical protein